MTTPRIVEQIIAQHPETGAVLVAQLWATFSAERQAFVLSTDDKITTQRAGYAHQVGEDYRRARGQLTRWVITEDRARDALEARGLPRQRQCCSCDEKLPIGGLYCLACGANQTVPLADQRRR